MRRTDVVNLPVRLFYRLVQHLESTGSSLLILRRICKQKPPLISGASISSPLTWAKQGLQWAYAKMQRIVTNTAMTQVKPSVTPKFEEPKFGFNGYAERLNSRAAMVGLSLTLLIEALTGQGLLTWLGLIH